MNGMTSPIQFTADIRITCIERGNSSWERICRSSSQTSGIVCKCITWWSDSLRRRFLKFISDSNVLRLKSYLNRLRDNNRRVACYAYFRFKWWWAMVATRAHCSEQSCIIMLTELIATSRNQTLDDGRGSVSYSHCFFCQSRITA